MGYVAICRTSYDFNYYLNASGAQGLLGQLVADHIPPWLVPLDSKVPASEHVTVYRVLQDRLPR
jgi:TorA maturation chaperone TorD